MFSTLLVAIGLIVAQETTISVTFAFLDEPQYANATFVVQSYQGRVPCTNIQVVGNERHCTAELLPAMNIAGEVRPNMARLQAIVNGSYGPFTNFVQIAQTENLPGPFRVTFAGVLPSPPLGAQTMAKQAVPTAQYTYADNNVLDFPTTLTLSVWLNFADLTTSSFLLNKFGNYHISQDNANVIFIYTTSASHPPTTIGPNQFWGWSVAIPSTGTWHNFVMVVNADDPTTMYVNGVSTGTGPSFFGGFTRDLTQPLRIGANNGSGPWNGAISHLAGWNSVLSSGDVTTLQTTLPTSVGSPQMYIDFDTSINEQLAGISPSVIGTFNTVTGPSLSGGGGGGAVAFYYLIQQ